MTNIVDGLRILTIMQNRWRFVILGEKSEKNLHNVMNHAKKRKLRENTSESCMGFLGCRIWIPINLA